MSKQRITRPAWSSKADRRSAVQRLAAGTVSFVQEVMYLSFRKFELLYPSPSLLR